MPKDSANTGLLTPSTFTGYLKMELRCRGVNVVSIPSGAYSFPQVAIDFDGYRPLAGNQRGPRMPVCLLWIYSGYIMSSGEHTFDAEIVEASMAFVWDKLNDMVNDPYCPVSMFAPTEPRGSVAAQQPEEEFGISQFHAQTIEVGSGEFFAQQGYFQDSTLGPVNDDYLFNIDTYDYENDPDGLFVDGKYKPFVSPVDNMYGYDSHRFLPRRSP